MGTVQSGQKLSDFLQLAEGAARMARGELDLEIDSRERRRHLRQLVTRGQQLGVPVPAGLKRFLEDKAPGGMSRGAEADRGTAGAALDWETFFGRVLKAEEGVGNGGDEEGGEDERELGEGQKRAGKGKKGRKRKMRESADEGGKRLPKQEAADPVKAFLGEG